VTKEEAMQLSAQIELDCVGLVRAWPEVYRNTGRIRLLLVAGQRTALVYKQQEWESIALVWYGLLLPEETIEIEPLPGKPPPAPCYLVDGIPMRIRRLKSGAKSGTWVGAYQEDGRTRIRYFGKQDPRPNYPLVEEVTV
jgi:hypothetical protein